MAARSKSNRLTKSGVIVNPHFGQVVFSEARILPSRFFRSGA